MLAVILPNAVNEQVVSQGSWGTVQRLDQPRPWVEQKSHHGHAEGAALRDTARAKMGRSQAATHSIEINARGVEVSVGPQRACRVSSDLQEADEEPKLDLVKAFVDVSARPADVFALQLSIFKLQADKIPGILRTKRRSGPSKKRVILPSLDPRRSPHQGRHSPDAVADRQEREPTKPLRIEVILAFAQEGCPRLFEKLWPRCAILNGFVERSHPLQSIGGKQEEVPFPNAIQAWSIVGHGSDDQC